MVKKRYILLRYRLLLVAGISLCVVITFIWGLASSSFFTGKDVSYSEQEVADSDEEHREYSWEGIAAGVSANYVRQNLGDPDRVEYKDDGSTTWYYCDQAAGGMASHYIILRDGRVNSIGMQITGEVE